MPRDEEEAVPLSPTEEYYRSIFNRVDTDGDGFINISELSQMIRHNHYDFEISPEVVDKIHNYSDTNSDGRLDYPEFVAMINNPGLQQIFGTYVNKYVNFVVPRRALGGVDQVDLQYEDEYTCCPPKLGMIVVSVVELIFFLVDELSEKNSTKFASGPMAQIFIYDPKKRQECWRFLTYMFVHIGHLHLIVNLLVQIFIGLPLEMVHGWMRVLAIYTAGVIAGSLGTSITDPTTKLAGASGGVYSLITAHISTIILNWGEMTFPFVQLALFMVITGVDVGTSIYNRYVENNADDHIGYTAHLAGAIAGLLVGINVLRNLKVTKKEKVVWWLSMITYVSLMVGAISWNIFYTDYFPEPA